MDFTIGTVVFDDWVITRKLGEGGFGRAFEIEKNGFGIKTKSALKTVSIPKTEDVWKEALLQGIPDKQVRAYYQKIAAAYIKEVAYMNTLKSHPNIVAIEDYMVKERASGMGWEILIRMELLTPLEEYIRTQICDVNMVLKLGISLCSALLMCEERKVIHRDIKPANIFYSESGYFKLGDFGLARTAEQTMGQYTKGAGTPVYEAPEVYLGRPYGRTADIYCTGLVLYELLNEHKLPFFTKTFGQGITKAEYENWFHRRLKGEAFPPPAGCPKEIWGIIQKACAYRPEDRYGSANEMLRELKEIYRARKQASAKVPGGFGMHGQPDKKSPDIREKPTDNTRRYYGLELYPALEKDNWCWTLSGSSDPVKQKSRLLFQEIGALSAETMLRMRKKVEEQTGSSEGFFFFTSPGYGEWMLRRKVETLFEEAGLHAVGDIAPAAAQMVGFITSSAMTEEKKILSVAVRNNLIQTALATVGCGIQEIRSVCTKYYPIVQKQEDSPMTILKELCRKGLEDALEAPKQIDFVLYSEQAQDGFLPLACFEDPDHKKLLHDPDGWKKFLKYSFPSAKVIQASPLSAARGAAILAEFRSFKEKMPKSLELVLYNMYHSLFAGTKPESAVCVVESNLLFPFQKTQPFVLMKNELREITLHLYEESEMQEGKPKMKIGSFRISGFSTKETKDLKIDVDFSHDANPAAKLLITAKEHISGKALKVDWSEEKMGIV